MNPEGNPLLDKSEKEIHKIIQESNITVAKSFSDLVRSSLGPLGAHKIIIDEDGFIIVTRDGRTIFDNICVDHPIEGMMLELSMLQDDIAGDGTTSVVILAGELLTRAQELLEKGLHPSNIVNGYTLAMHEATLILNELAVAVSSEEKKILLQIARTSLNSKILAGYRDLFADMVVEAVLRTRDDRNIYFESSTGGSIRDIYLFNGMILENRTLVPHMQSSIQDPKILLLNSKLKLQDAKHRLGGAVDLLLEAGQITRMHMAEFAIYSEIVQKIGELGVNVVLNSRKMDPVAMDFFRKAGIFAVRNLPSENLRRIADLTGGKIISEFGEIGEDDLGSANSIKEEQIGDHRFILIEKEDSPVLTVMIRGGTKQMVDEVKRTLNDAIQTTIHTLEDRHILPGGGAIEVEVASRLRKYAYTIESKEQLAVLAFADALESIPKILAINSGMDPISTLISLKQEHAGGEISAGIDAEGELIVDTIERGIIEPLGMKRQVIHGAAMTAIMILRVDDFIPRKDLEKRKADLTKEDIKVALKSDKDVEDAYRDAVNLFGRKNVRDMVKVYGWESVPRVLNKWYGKEVHKPLTTPE
ncbi:MAG: thermosome subunit alpha [Candidatus Syntrophoarchaeum sp.]|nr:thermosome subunit alpha [Candidatus Syntrophoarchaeum sp.]